MSQSPPNPTQEAVRTRSGSSIRLGPWMRTLVHGRQPSLWRLCFGQSYSDNNFGGAGSSRVGWTHTQASRTLTFQTTHARLPHPPLIDGSCYQCQGDFLDLFLNSSAHFHFTQPICSQIKIPNDKSIREDLPLKRMFTFGHCPN